MKVKLLALTIAIGLCLILSSLVLYRTNSKRVLNVSGDNLNHTLAATDITLSGVTQRGDLYTVKLDRVNQLAENLYELNLAVIEHTNHITKSTQKFYVKCKTVTVHYRPNSEKVDKIEFKDGVTITSLDKVAYGDSAEFISQENIVVLYGNAALKEKHSYIKGEKVIYKIESDIFKVIGSTQVIINDR